MKFGLEPFLFLFGCFDAMLEGSTLQCWKCISHDCNTDPEMNYKAAKVKCQEGQQCMKVRYRMFDNVTHYDSVIRTCTTNPCLDKVSLDEFYKCVASPRQYMISGCTLRSCCGDRDLCNSGRRVEFSVTVTVVTLSSIMLLFNVDRRTILLLSILSYSYFLSV